MAVGVSIQFDRSRRLTWVLGPQSSIQYELTELTYLILEFSKDRFYNLGLIAAFETFEDFLRSEQCGLELRVVSFERLRGRTSLRYTASMRHRNRVGDP